MSAQVGTLTVREQIGKFAGQCQKGTVAAKVNMNAIFKDLTLHITGMPSAYLFIACASRLGNVAYDALFLKYLNPGSIT